jgi:hypothetical protein
MPKVFISHAWEDNEISRKLAEYLMRDGAEIWIDTSRVTGGDILPDAIGEGIAWCDVFLLVWSKSAKDSYYVTLERNCAIDNRKRIIPCVIDDEKLPTILSAFLRIDFKNFEQGYCHLASDLKFIPKQIMLRSNPQELSQDEVKEMLKKYDFFDSYDNKNGHGFDNLFEQQTIKKDEVFIDGATGLMWQQSGSADEMNFENANEWIKELNLKGFAGFNDWRLPTLEEALSLMEPEENKNGLYIHPLFDYKQTELWTTDLLKGEDRAWVAYFNGGSCSVASFYGYSYVRAVRSIQSSQE